jgi:hypothetical protein
MGKSEVAVEIAQLATQSIDLACDHPTHLLLEFHRDHHDNRQDEDVLRRTLTFLVLPESL